MCSARSNLASFMQASSPMCCIFSEMRNLISHTYHFSSVEQQYISYWYYDILLVFWLHPSVWSVKLTQRTLDALGLVIDSCSTLIRSAVLMLKQSHFGPFQCGPCSSICTGVFLEICCPSHTVGAWCCLSCWITFVLWIHVCVRTVAFPAHHQGMGVRLNIGYYVLFIAYR